MSKKKSKPAPVKHLTSATSLIIRWISDADKKIIKEYRTTHRVQRDSWAIVAMMREHPQLVKERDKLASDLASLRETVLDLVNAHKDRAEADKAIADALKSIGDPGKLMPGHQFRIR